MSAGSDIACFFGGLFASNGVPHLVAGMLGRPFQSPFAKPSGEGYSSSTVNVLWGWLNLVIGHVLLFRVGAFDVRSVEHVLSAGVAAFAMSLFAARHFGKFNGGSTPLEEQAKRGT